jgi:filamentous hemagglutinin family protein
MKLFINVFLSFLRKQESIASVMKQRIPAFAGMTAGGIMNCPIKLIFFIFILFCFAVPGLADESHPQGITLDGTLGTAGNLSLPGPNYEIKAEYGQQAGANLFHSFQQFNIHSGESARFTGPDSVQNIISRVTGGSASWVDGALRSEIPGADFYLLNTAGIMFGPNAALDLGGSFHAGTADYLRFGENERFYTMAQENEVLSVAAPTAFGFLDNDVAAITFEGRGEITEEEWEENPTGFNVAEGETISFIGGDIEITNGIHYETQEVDEDGNPLFEKAKDENGYPFRDAEGNYVLARDEEGNLIPIMVTAFQEDIEAPGGQINMVSVASPGEAVLTSSAPDTFAFEKMGNIKISEAAIADVSGSGSGNIFIRGEQIVLDAGELWSNTLGDKDGGKISIEGKEISLTNCSVIYSTTYEKGRGGNVILKASESVTLSGDSESTEGSKVELSTQYNDENAGNAGDLLIEAKNISLSESTLRSSTHGKGNAGDITIKASESFNSARSFYHLTSEQESSGKGGKLLIEAKDILFETGSFVNSVTYGEGNAGDVTLKSSESFGLGISSSILLSVSWSSTGDGGTLFIQAKDISIEDFSTINSGTYGGGKGGSVKLEADKSVTISDSSILARTVGSNEEAVGGTVSIETKDLYLNEGSDITTTASKNARGGDVTIKASETVMLSGTNTDGTASKIHTSALSEAEDAGDAGNVLIEANALLLKDGGWIQASTQGAGNGGQITIHAAENAELVGGNPHGENADGFSSGIYADSSGTSEHAGKAGDILITAGALRIQDGARISNSTKGHGQGGVITVEAEGPVTITGDSLQIEFQADDSDEPVPDYKSGIYSGSESQESSGGEAGKIHLTAWEVNISHNGKITTSSMGGGNAGDIILNAEQISLDSSASVASESKSPDNGGAAGTLSIHAADSIRLTNNSFLTTEAVNTKERSDETEGKDNGRIDIGAENTLSLSDSRITSSVKGGTGNGGDIRIAEPEFVILKRSDITANAYEGTGGNIRITSDQFIQSSGSLVNASSELGIDGSVDIESPDADVSSGLTVMPENFLDPGRWTKSLCDERSGKVSRFIVIGTDTAPLSFEDWCPSPPLLPGDSEESMPDASFLTPYLDAVR